LGEPRMSAMCASVAFRIYLKKKKKKKIKKSAVYTYGAH
jgi:hypothetical protein